MKLPGCVGLLLALLVASWPAATAQSSGRYTVEIIVFRTGGGAPAGETNTRAATKSSTTPIEATASATRRLTGAAARLRAANGYRVLAHTAWSQAPAAWNSHRGVSAAQIGLTGAGISGDVIVERGQYLHLGFDLMVEDGGQIYHIAEIRRVKADEAQYFDHPAVGIIALVTAGG
jgi:hypothetical protein